MKKYGLQLRIPFDQQKNASKPSIRPSASIFGNGDEEGDHVSKDVPRKAPKSRSLQMIEEQQKKTLEEDPSAFDYDGVYDEMKSNASRSRVIDQSKREPKYISSIIETVKKREREHEIIYERKLLKERSKDDHIYEDKEKFVTSAYKQKLAERANWIEEERLCKLREEKDDVTKKSDLTDFYFSLGKNVAFGAGAAHSSIRSNSAEDQADPKALPPPELFETVIRRPIPPPDSIYPALHDENNAPEAVSKIDEVDPEVTVGEKAGQEIPGKIHDGERFKRNQESVAAARERFLARKKARQQL